MKMESEVIQGKKVTPKIKKWHDYAMYDKLNIPNRLEEVAKFTSSLIGVMLSIVGFGLGSKMISLAPSHLKFTMILWTLSIAFSLAVLFPLPFKYAEQSQQSIEKAFWKRVKYKYIFLILSVVCFLSALLILFLNIE